MADSILDLVLRIRKQGKGIPEAQVEFKGLGDIIGGLKQKVVELAGPAALAGVVALMSQAVTKAANYGDEMGDLAAITGQTVEETSRMSATLELLGINSETTKRLLKNLSDDGINLTMESLQNLRAQYKALESPQEKQAFLFDKFKKSAYDMAEVMDKDEDSFKRLAAAAETSAKVIGEDVANAAEHTAENFAILEQKTDGLLIKWGNNLMPTIQYLTDFMTMLDSRQGDVNQAQLEAWGISERLTPAWQKQAAAAQSAFIEMEHGGEAYGAVYTHAMMAADAIDTSNTAAATFGATMGGAFSGVIDPARSYRDVTSEMAAAQERVNAAASGAGQAIGVEAAQALQAAGVKGDEYLAALLAIDQITGTSLRADEDKRIALEKINTEYRKTGDIDAYKAAIQKLYSTDLPAAKKGFDDAAAAAGYLADKYQQILDKPDITKTITINTVTTNSGAGAGSGQNIGFASGGSFIVPGSGSGDRPYIVPLEPGERVDVTPRSLVNNSSTTNMGGVNIYVSGAGDPDAVAERVMVRFAAKTRAARNSGMGAMGVD